jgi:hypothetical protein
MKLWLTLRAIEKRIAAKIGAKELKMSEQNRMYWGLKELRFLMDEDVALDRIKEKVDALMSVSLGCQCSERYNYVVDQQKRVVEVDGSEIVRLTSADVKCHWEVDLHMRPGTSEIVRVTARRA